MHTQSPFRNTPMTSLISLFRRPARPQATGILSRDELRRLVAQMVD